MDTKKIENQSLQTSPNQILDQKKILKSSRLIAILPIIVVSFFLGMLFSYLRKNESPSRSILKKPSDIKVTSKPLQQDQSVTPSPSSRLSGIVWRIPITARCITYEKGKSIFLRNLNNGKLSSEREILSSEDNAKYYEISKDLKYVAYSYYADPNLENSREEMSGNGDAVVIKDLITSKKTKILSDLTKNNLVAGLSFSNKLDKLFISLDNDDIYSYDIPTNKIKMIHKELNKHDNFCRGYYVIDESPNRENLIVSSLCWEGTVIYVFGINSDTFTKVGGGYIGGTAIIKFLNDGEIYGNTYGGEEKERYFKFNLKGEIVQELPEPSKAEISQNALAIYNEDETGIIFMTNLGKEVLHDVDIDKTQIIGTGVEDIRMF